MSGGGTSFGTSRGHLPEARRRCSSTGRFNPQGLAPKSRQDLLRVGVVRLVDVLIRELAVERLFGWELGLVKARPGVHVLVGIHTFAHDQFASCLVRLVLCCDLEASAWLAATS